MASSGKAFLFLLLLSGFVTRTRRHCTSAFAPSVARTITRTARTVHDEAATTTSLFMAKKKKKKRQESKGFGKVEVENAPLKKSTDSAPSSTSVSSPPAPSETSSPFLQSVKGGLDSVPVMEKPKTEVEVDNSLPPEERAKQILREKYGMKSLEEQQLDAKQLEQKKEQRKKMAEWKKKAEMDEEFDFVAMIPGPVLIGLDRFLKAGIAVVGTAFIASGIAITFEAWSKASDQPLPDDMESFIVNVIEPNFTTGLLVLLSFSISLGALAAAQLGSAGAQYREDE